MQDQGGTFIHRHLSFAEEIPLQKTISLLLCSGGNHSLSPRSLKILWRAILWGLAACWFWLTHCLHEGCSLCFTLLTVLLLPDKLSIHLMCLIFCASVLGKQSSFAPHLPSNFSQNQHAEVCCQLKHRCQVDELWKWLTLQRERVFLLHFWLVS